MAYSMVVAEPVGVFVGIVCGELGKNWGQELCKEHDIPVVVGSIGGTVIGHYLSSVVVKGLINAGLIDPVGGVANVGVTSPSTALIHGLVSTLSWYMSEEQASSLASQVVNSSNVQNAMSGVW